MNNIRLEFAHMAKYDVALMESVTDIHQWQLQKNILLQRLIGIAEETGFEQSTFARGSYLRDQLKSIQGGFDHYVQLGAQGTLRARRTASTAFDMAGDRQQRAQLRDMLEGLNRLESARRAYDADITRILNAVEAGGFQLSLEDLEHCEESQVGVYMG